MKNIALLMLIASVIMVSGCIGPGPTVTSSYGVNILSFTPFPSEIESGEAADLDLSVQNTGGVKAEDVYAYLFSPSDWILSGSKLQSIGILEGPDEVSNIAGETGDASWTLTAPNRPLGITYPTDLKVRLFYKYITTASTSVPMLKEGEYKRILRSGGSLPAQSSTLVSKGPLGVKIDSRPGAPIKVKGDDIFSVIITVENLGDGEVFNKEKFEDMKSKGTVSYDDLYRMNITINAPANIIEKESCDALNGKDELSLRRGKTATYRCKLKVKSLEISPQEDLPITVILRYAYFIDSTTSISVTGAS